MDAKTLAGQLDDVQVIDVREPFEWDAGRIEGSKHIPMTELAQRMNEIDRSLPAVAVCFAGARSAYASNFLQSQGLHVESLDGGLKSWVGQGLPLAADGGAPGKLIHDPPPVTALRESTAGGSSTGPSPQAGPPSTGELTDEEGAVPAWSPNLSPEMEELKNTFIEAVFAAQDRFGDEEPSEAEMRVFMREWLMSKGKSAEEAEEILDR